MVIMIRLTTEALLAVLMASKYKAAPISVAMIIERSRAGKMESPADLARKKDSMPPSITKSP